MQHFPDTFCLPVQPGTYSDVFAFQPEIDHSDYMRTKLWTNPIRYININLLSIIPETEFEGILWHISPDTSQWMEALRREDHIVFQGVDDPHISYFISRK